MLATDAYELDRVNPNLAVGYEKVFTTDGVAYRNDIFEHVIRGGPAGGGYSTVDDLHRFARALQTGRLVQPATLALMVAPRPELASPTYGYGFGINADGSLGHTGGFAGIVRRSPSTPTRVTSWGRCRTSAAPAGPSCESRGSLR
jgi:D-alanyl-D-alanine carboxypeptidase